MILFSKVVKAITKMNRWIAFWILVLMMPVVTIFSIARTTGHPIVGDVELVQFAMVILIVGSLAFTEVTNAHISIGIIVDRLPASIQTIIDIIAQVLTVAFCLIVCYVYIFKMDWIDSSALLSISFWPFKTLLIFGFLAWGLEALLKFCNSIKSLMNVLSHSLNSKMNCEEDRSIMNENTN